MLERVLEPETMDSEQEARDYDAMDHTEVNRRFVHDFLKVHRGPWPILDVGTGTARIPIELCRTEPLAQVLAVDLAYPMLRVAQENIRAAGLVDRIQLQRAHARRLPFRTGSFSAVISNSLIHHVPDPEQALREAIRVLATGGVLFFRDLLRPPDEATLEHLVRTYAAGCNAHQQQLFAASLRAALSLEELRVLAATLGIPKGCVSQTSDRHWTLVWEKPRWAEEPAEPVRAGAGDCAKMAAPAVQHPA